MARRDSRGGYIRPDDVRIPGRRGRSLVRVLTIALLAAGSSITAPPAPLAAQVSRDEAAEVLLGAARTFEDDGQAEVARAIYELILRRYAGTPAATEARARLDAAPAAVDFGDGRTELMIWSTTYGLFLGVAIPTALGASTAPPYGVGLLLGGPGGFLAGRAIAGSRPISVGQARAVTWAGTWGTWQGAGWRDVFDIGESELCDAFGNCFDTEDTIEETFAAMVVGGTAGLIVGNVLSYKDITAGTATAVNFGSLWGTWFGWAGGYVADLDGDALLVSTLVGGDVGLLFTALAAPQWNVTRNRARRVSIAGVIGLFVGLGLELIAEPESSRAQVALPMATSAIGLAFGAATTAGSGGGGSERGEVPDGALLSLRGGHWGLDAPLPFPVVRERAGRAGPERRTGWGVTLLSARF